MGQQGIQSGQEDHAQQHSARGVRSRAISRKLRAVQTMDDASAAALLELDTEPGRPVSARLPESRGDE